MIRLCVLTFVVLLAAAGTGAAQEYQKGWLDVNFGAAAAAAKSVTSSRTFTISQETGAGAVAYDVPKGGSFDVSFGYMFDRRVGVGASLAGTAHEGHAGLAISVPHPLYFNASASDADATSGTLERQEGAWHVHAMVVALDTPHARIRVFGGPSYFSAEQQVVSNIRYEQSYQVFGRGNIVDITTYETEKSTGTGWGGHVGADVAYFFNRTAGIGFVMRFSRGSANIDDYGGTHSVKTGGAQFGGGLRLKF